MQVELDALRQARDDRHYKVQRTVVRNGYKPRRVVLFCVGPLPVSLFWIRDCAGRVLRFMSSCYRAALKSSHWLQSLLPCLYLGCVSTIDFDESPKSLFGDSVKDISASTTSRL